MLINIIALALSLSIDSFGIGMSYGMRKIKVPFSAAVILSVMAFSFSGLSILAGSILLKILPPLAAKLIGVSILMFMGVWIIIQGFRKKSPDVPKEDKTILNLIIKSLGITIKIIRTPESCDMNHSSEIEPSEALYLGFALSIDSIGAGIGTAIIGLNTMLMPFCVALFQLLFLFGGLEAGKKLILTKINNKLCIIISGGILICVGFIRLILT